MTAGGLFTIEVRRGEVVESKHRVHAVVVDRFGAVQAWGDRSRPTIARSAIKSVQALPIVTTGAADALSVSREELALACASHSGEAEHVDAVRAWLGRLELSELDLECGPDTPLGLEAKKQFYRDGIEPSAIYNCCSGKHAGFLTVARHLGVATDGYISRQSPVQQLVTASVETMTGLDLSQVASGHDGCGIPVFALPLERLAFAMARLVDPEDLDPPLASAALRVAEAAQQAFWVSGTDRTEVDVCGKATQPVVIKTGAEGMFMAGLPQQGLGIALKVADGTSRASQAAIRTVLCRLGVLSAADARPAPLLNKAGRIVGELRSEIGAPASARLAAADVFV